MKKLLIGLIGLAIIGAYFSPLPQKAIEKVNETLGAADTTLNIGGFPYYVNAPGLSSTASSIILTSFTLPQTGQKIQDSDLSSTFYVTLEPGNRERQEFVSCTTVAQNSGGTATLSGCTRGLSPITPYTASSTLQFSHGARSILIFSNPPQQQNQFYALGNVATSTNILNFSSTTPPRYDHTGAQSTGTYIATTSELASIAYVNSVANAGTANGTESVKGIWEGATAIEQASSTILGSTGAGLVQQSRYATSTPTYSCDSSGVIGALCTVIARNSGKIHQLWIDLTEAFTWTGLHTFSGGLTATATTTLAGSNVNSNAIKINTIPYSFPSSQGLLGQIWRNDGNGNLSWGGAPQYTFATTTAIVTTTSATTTAIVIPAGVLTASSTIQVMAHIRCVSNSSCKFSVRESTGNSTTFVGANVATPASGRTWRVNPVVNIFANNSTSAQVSTMNYMALDTGTVSGIVPGDSNDVSATSAFDTSNATSIVGVIEASGSTATLFNMTVIVRP